MAQVDINVTTENHVPHKISADELILKDITELSVADALAVLLIRNEAGIRRNMYTDHLIDDDEHLKWIEHLRASDTARFYAVLHEALIVGGVGISSINTRHRRADWAFYLSETCQGRGFGSALERKFISFAFEHFDIDKLNCEVIEFNTAVISMHERFGFSQEGVRRDHVIRDGQKFGAVLLGLRKSEWNPQ